MGIHPVKAPSDSLGLWMVMYPDSGYSDGMRLVWFADTGVNPWGIHAFGNYDWHESADSKYWYYYMRRRGKIPNNDGSFREICF